MTGCAWMFRREVLICGSRFASEAAHHIFGIRRFLLAATAEFERERIRERVMAALQRARTQGKRLGRPSSPRSEDQRPGGSVRAAASIWGVSKTTAAKWIG